MGGYAGVTGVVKKIGRPVAFPVIEYGLGDVVLPARGGLFASLGLPGFPLLILIHIFSLISSCMNDFLHKMAAPS
jgi:hypothetical protein